MNRKLSAIALTLVLLSSLVVGCGKKDNHPEEAALFGEFLLTEEMQKLRFELTGSLPSTDITVDSPYIPGFLKQLDYAFPMPSIPEMSAYWDAMNSASANIWDGADIKTELDAVDAAILGK